MQTKLLGRQKRTGFRLVGRNFWKYKALLLMMVPIIVITVINGYLPIFGLLIAFKDINYADGILMSPWVGIDNFKFLFSNASVINAVVNTLLYNAVFIVLGMILAVAVAIGLNEMKSKIAAKTYQTLMILPYFLSMVVVSYVVYGFLHYDNGYSNRILVNVFGMEKVNWYFEAKYWPAILILVRMWHQVGYGSIIYLAALCGIDQSLYEAARIDGATKPQMIRKITIPLLKPVMIIMLILSIGNIVKGDFGLFYQVPLGSGALISTTDIIDTFVYRSLMSLNDIGMSSAAGFLQSVIGFIMVMISNGIIRKIDPEQAMF